MDISLPAPLFIYVDFYVQFFIPHVTLSTEGIVIGPGLEFLNGKDTKTSELKDVTQLILFSLFRRCGHNYCASHRYAEAHSCGFDYKSEGRKLLEQNNPLVSAPKLPKI